LDDPLMSTIDAKPTKRRFDQSPRHARVARKKPAPVANAFLAVDETLIADGYTVRRGGPDEPKRAKPLPEWRKPPPENP
jgi:hypothetical protein